MSVRVERVAECRVAARGRRGNVAGAVAVGTGDGGGGHDASDFEGALLFRCLAYQSRWRAAKQTLQRIRPEDGVRGCPR